MKKFIFILSVLALVNVFGCFNVYADVADDIYFDYIDVIKGYKIKNDLQNIFYFVYDIDKNGVPELVIEDTALPSVSDIYVYSHKNSQAEFIEKYDGGRTRFFEYPGNGLAISYTMDGYGHMELVALDNYGLNKIKEWEVEGCNELNLLPEPAKIIEMKALHDETIDFEWIKYSIKSRYWSGDENQYWSYSTSGLMSADVISEVKISSDWTSICDPGAIVDANRGIFDTHQTTVSNYPYEEYSVFSSSTGDETLTLGIIENPYVYGKEDPMDKAVSSQIAYIQRIGGVMTGYSTDSDGMYDKCVNISWDVSGSHHFARFEYETCYGRIGYYDLMYFDERQIDTHKMNLSFRVLGEYQGEY